MKQSDRIPRKKKRQLIVDNVIRSVFSSLFCVEKTSNMKSSRPRNFRVECIYCCSNFNNDYKITHEQNMHDETYANVKIIGALANLFAACLPNEGRNVEGGVRRVAKKLVNVTKLFFYRTEKIGKILLHCARSHKNLDFFRYCNMK